METPFEGIREDLLSDISPEELNQLASLMTDALLQTTAYSVEIITPIPAMTSDEAIRLVSLDLISSYTAGITDPLGQLRDWFTSVFNTIASWIVSGVQSFINQYVIPTINAISSTIASLINQVIVPAISGIPNAISSFISNTVMPALSGFISSITNFFSQTVIPSITGFISNVVIPAINTVSSFISNTVMPAISGVISSISSFISNTIIPAFSSFSSSILNAFSGFASTISSILSNTIIPALTSIPQITFRAISGALSQASQMVISGITGFISQYVMPAFNLLSGSVQGFVNMVLNGINTIVNNVTAGFQSVANIFTGFINALMNLPNWFMEYIVRPIGEALSRLGEWIWNALPDWLRNALTGIVEFFTKTLPEWFNAFIKGLQDFIADPLGWINKNLVKPLMDGLKAVGEWIWNALPQWLKDALIGIRDFFTKTLPEGWNAFVKGVQEFLADPLGWLNRNLVEPLMNGLKAVGDWIWNALPDWLKNGLIAVGDFFKGVAEGIINFFKDPWGTLQNIGSKVWEGLQTLGSMIWNALQTLGKMFMQGLEWLWNMIVGGIKALINAFIGAGATIIHGISELVSGQFHEIWYGVASLLVGFTRKTIDFIRQFPVEVGEIITSLFKDIIEPTQKSIESVLEKPFMESVKKLAEGKESAGQWIEIWNMYSTLHLALLSGQAYSVLQWLIFHAIGVPLEKIEIKFPIKLKFKGKAKGTPLGVGGEAGGEAEGGFEVPLTVNFGKLFHELASEVRSYGKDLAQAMITGLGVWLSRPMTRYASSALRNWLPVELPTFDIMVEMMRRHMSHKDFDKVLEKNREFLRLYGYNDEIIRWLTEKDMSITIKDRFGNTRVVPLSLIYELPSVSDVATMMVRDIFPDIEEFNKLYKARGMHEDIGALYYMLRFRYPPPEKLWQFTTRGISGLLWSKVSQDELRRIESEASKIGAFVPRNAVDLNFDAKTLFEAYYTYMKWHDYAKFSWLSGFTSDNQIITDVQADIPTKIDLRWMSRFALFELATSKGVTLDSEISKLRTALVETAPKSQIIMDLTLMSRFIQATGMHPDLVPITAVAETINAIADERTLLRTASLNLFKEGFFDVESIESALGGVISASFKVASFNTTFLKWETGFINVPLTFLPPERKLTELRAIMDRAMDILKEIQRDITIAYQEYIILSYDEYKKTMEEVIQYVNEFFSSDFQKITGQALPESLKLKFVEEYYKPYVNALTIFREVHIVRRIRAWTQRWLGWIMYRVATGIASLEDVERLIDATAKWSKLSSIEKDFLKEIMKIMYTIASREYIPTPSQLLTMSEYVAIPDALIEKVFKARFMSQEWASIWKQYINIRTIADDVKSLISTYMYVLRYVDVKSKYESVIKGYAQMIGFTDKELAILDLRAELEEALRNARENVREYIPSPSMLASMSEYLPEVREYFDDVVKAKNIPARWIPLWSRYIDIKPLVNDVKTYLTRAEQLYARFMITEEDFKKVLEQVRDYLGYTDKEIEFLMLITRYERHRTAWTELIGDVDRMVMLAEYSPKARDFALGTLYKMIDALPIDSDTKNVLKEMWEQFIRVKPVIEEVKRYVTDLINAYVDGTISDTLLDSELKALKEWGLDDYEIMFYKAMAGMRKARKLKITLG